jgi:hypothetical protein
MSALGGASLDQAQHELAQGRHVEGAMLQFVDDEIVVGLGKFQTDVIAVAALRAGIIDGLPIGQELNGLVDAFGLVARVTTLRPEG